MSRREIALYAVTLIYVVLLSAFIMVVPLYVQSLGYSLAAVGVVVAAQALLQVGSRIPAGMVSDRLGERPILLAAFALLAVSALMLTVATGLTVVILSQLLMGVSRAIFWVPAQALAARLEPEGAGKRLGWQQSMGAVGAMMGPVLAGAGIEWAGYLWTLKALSAVMLASPVCLVMLPAVAPAGAARAPREALAAMAVIARRPPSYVAGAMTFLAAAMRGLIVSFQPVYLAAVGISPGLIGLLGAGRSLAEAGISPMAGALAARRSGILLAGAVLGAGIGTAWMAGLTSLPLLLVAVCLTGVGSNVMHVCGLHLAAADAGPQGRGQAMGFNGTFWALGLLFSPLALGAVAQAAGLAAALSGGGIAVIAMGGAVWAGYRHFFGANQGGWLPYASSAGTTFRKP